MDYAKSCFKSFIAACNNVLSEVKYSVLSLL